MHVCRACARHGPYGLAHEGRCLARLALQDAVNGVLDEDPLVLYRLVSLVWAV